MKDKNNIVKNVNNSFNNMNKNVKKVVDNEILINIVRVCLILYTAFLIPTLTHNQINIVNNNIFRIVVVALIVYLSFMDMITAILLTIAFLVTLHHSNIRNKNNNNNTDGQNLLNYKEKFVDVSTMLDLPELESNIITDFEQLPKLMDPSNTETTSQIIKNNSQKILSTLNNIFEKIIGMDNIKYKLSNLNSFIENKNQTNNIPTNVYNTMTPKENILSKLHDYLVTINQVNQVNNNLGNDGNIIDKLLIEYDNAKTLLQEIIDQMEVDQMEVGKKAMQEKVNKDLNEQKTELDKHKEEEKQRSGLTEEEYQVANTSAGAEVGGGAKIGSDVKEILKSTQNQINTVNENAKEEVGNLRKSAFKDISAMVENNEASKETAEITEKIKGELESSGLNVGVDTFQNMNNNPSELNTPSISNNILNAPKAFDTEDNLKSLNNAPAMNESLVYTIKNNINNETNVRDKDLQIMNNQHPASKTLTDNLVMEENRSINNNDPIGLTTGQNLYDVSENKVPNSDLLNQVKSVENQFSAQGMDYPMGTEARRHQGYHYNNEHVKHFMERNERKPNNNGL